LIFGATFFREKCFCKSSEAFISFLVSWVLSLFNDFKVVFGPLIYHTNFYAYKCVNSHRLKTVKRKVCRNRKPMIKSVNLSRPTLTLACFPVLHVNCTRYSGFGVEYTCVCNAVVLFSYPCVVLAVPTRAAVSELTWCIRCLTAYCVDSPMLQKGKAAFQTIEHLLQLCLLRPFFFDATVSGDSYLHMLQTHVIPQLKRHKKSSTVFQQDGAPPHYSSENQVRTYLREQFSDERVIARGIPNFRPARSPDLTPLDYWFCGMIKARVYHENKPKNFVELRPRIEE
ncbi:hypothetical protein CLF_105869, partial [Clonorchis sinensis]